MLAAAAAEPPRVRMPAVRGEIDRYLSVVAEEHPDVNPGNLRFYLSYIFRHTPLEGRRALDIGAGDGNYSFYMAAAGASRVVALEPEADGSTAGVLRKFEQVGRRLGMEEVELRAETFQELDPGAEQFDVVLLHAAINHLDEQACMALHTDGEARRTYRELFTKLAALTAKGGHLIALDAARENLFAHLPVANPLAPTIEWEKHQSPRLWAEILEEAGFTQPRVRWNSLNTLRTPGRVLLGNRLASYFLGGGFCLTMVRA